MSSQDCLSGQMTSLSWYCQGCLSDNKQPTPELCHRTLRTMTMKCATGKMEVHSRGLAPVRNTGTSFYDVQGALPQVPIQIGA